jgi:hypothetical protein
MPKKESPKLWTVAQRRAASRRAKKRWAAKKTEATALLTPNAHLQKRIADLEAFVAQYLRRLPDKELLRHVTFTRS